MSGHRCHHCHHYEGYIPTLVAVCATQGPSHGLSHETTAMAIKKPITSSACRLTSAFCVWGPSVTMVPGPAFACEQLRQPSGVSHTHTTGRRWSYFTTVSHFCLLDLGKAGGDAQTQHTATVNSGASSPPLIKKYKKRCSH